MECSRPGCPLLRHPNPANNGGTHCCAACKRTGGHGPLCRQISLEEKKRKKKKTTKATSTTTKATTAPATTAPATTAPTTLLPVVTRTSDSGTTQTFYVKAGQTITVTLFAEWNFSQNFQNPGIFPGSNCKFTYTYPANGTIVLSNKDMAKNAVCIATMGTTSVSVPRNGNMTAAAPTIVGSVAMEWQNAPTAEYTALLSVLAQRSLSGGGGYWEVYGRLSNTP